MKCLIHGSFMNDNYGDFLLFDITADIVDNISDSDNIIVDNVDSSYYKYRTINRRSTWEGIHEADCAILTGGGYFGAPSKRIYKYYWDIRFVLVHALPFVYFAMKKKPYIIVGLGVGPLNSKISRWTAGYIIKHAVSVSVRDQESQEYIKNSLKINRKVNVYPDMVMGANISKYLSAKKWVENVINKNSKKNLAIHLTTKMGRDDEGIAIVIKDIQKYIRESDDGWNVYFVCDQGGSKQVERQKILAEFLDITGTKVIGYESPYKLTSLLDRMDIVITDKLHVGIVSTKLGKYVISTAAHPKTQRFYRQLGISDHCLNLNGIQKGEVLHLLKNYKGSSKKDLSVIINNSKKNSEEIKKFLNLQMNGI